MLKGKIFLALLLIVMLAMPTVSANEVQDVISDDYANCVYDAIGNFSEGLAIVCKDNKFGYMNEMGELVIPCQFDLAFNFSEGYARVYDYSNRLFWLH